MDYFLTQNSSLYCLSRNLYAGLFYKGSKEQNIRDRAIDHEIYQKEKLVSANTHPKIVLAWKEYFYWLEKIHILCEKENIPLVMLISPFEFQLNLTRDKDFPQEKLINFCKANGIKYFNYIDSLRLDYSIYRSRNTDIARPHLFWDRFFLDHDHYNEEGHRRVAKHLAPLISSTLNLF
tara:strand:- start:72 stop:605 length:534 start_codon:yes stop_codon:yes gene_type:complete